MIPLNEMGRFATVVVDPPWPLPKIGLTRKGFDLPYATMSLQEIGDLTIERCLAGDAWLFVWATNGTLFEAARMLSDWGCTYVFTMTWVKGGGIQLPNTPAFNSEWCLVGRHGSPKFVSTKAFSTANSWPRGRNSEKPEGFYDLLRRVTSGPRLDVFGRRQIDGFASWGNEAPSGEPGPGMHQAVMEYA